MIVEDGSLLGKRYAVLLIHGRGVGHVYYKGGW